MFHIFKIRGFTAFILIAFFNAFTDLGHKIIIQNTIFKFYSGPTQVTLTAIVNALILLPFILLFTPAGFLADKYPKNKVIKLSAIASVFIAIGITACYYLGWFIEAFILTFILAMQSAFYSPAKYAYIKELTGKENIAPANSFVQAVTITAILSGVFIYSVFFEKMIPESFDSLSTILTSIAPLGFLLISSTIINTILAYRLPQKTETDHQLKLNAKKYIKAQYLKNNLKLTKSNSVIWLSIIGLAMFWGVNQVVLATFGAYLKTTAGITNTVIAQGILAIGGIGVILGSLFAGKISRNFIETGLIPAGSIGITISLFLLPQITSPLLLSILFFLYGIVGGIFIVPLNSLIQFNAKESDLGKIMAGNNFIQNVVMFLFLMVTMLFAINNIGCVPVFYILFAVALIGSIYTFFKLPQAFIRYMTGILFSQRHKLQVMGLKNLPSTGGVLLMGNHTSWLDWAVLQISCPRKIRFVMERSIYEKWYLRKFLSLFNVIAISSRSSKRALKTIEKALNNNEVVALFPEGAISRNGQLSTLKKGFEIAIRNTNAQIVPFYMRGLWGTIYSHSSKKAKRTANSSLSHPITVCFGKPISKDSSAAELKQAIFRLSIYTWQHYTNSLEPVHVEWLKTAKTLKNRLSIVDYTRITLTHHKLIAAVLSLSSELKKITKNEKTIGLLLPASSAGVIMNLAAMISGKTFVNLNYTSSPESLKQAIKQADIKTVFTSKQFLVKLKAKKIDLTDVLQTPKTIYMEDLKETCSKLKLLRKFLVAKFMPVSLIKLFYFKKTTLDDTATILFSSGSEGTPKGVELSHRNIIANIKQISTVLDPTDKDVVLSTLPLFHAFGLTVTTLMPLCEGIPFLCYPDPTDAQAIGKLASKYKATFLCATSTFLRLYTRNKKLHPLMFKSLRIVISGAEKLNHDVKAAFKEKFNKDIFEGYGTTETTPVASVNIPDILIADHWNIQIGHKEGTVGLPIPGSALKIVDPETMETLPAGEAGLILIGGPQIMKGYLNDKEKTDKVITYQNGIRWYKTGDKGKLDNDGFLTILDRYSRFAKIAGEMISLSAVEEKVSDIINNEEIEVCAAALPDDKKGEKIVLLISGEIETDQLKKNLIEKNINPLMLPSSFRKVKTIPKLGTGKNDFAAIRNLASSIC